MVKLELRPRRERPDGLPGWHDSFRLQAALDAIGKGKPISRLGLWLGIARKVQLAQAEAGLTTSIDAVVTVELEEGEAKALWAEVEKLTPESLQRNVYTGQPQVPDLATLGEMLEEWEEALT